MLRNTSRPRPRHACRPQSEVDSGCFRTKQHSFLTTHSRDQTPCPVAKFPPTSPSRRSARRELHARKIGDEQTSALAVGNDKIVKLSGDRRHGHVARRAAEISGLGKLPRQNRKQNAPRDKRGWYIGSMKQKTSITLSTEVLARIDRLAGSRHSRSGFIERLLRRYLRERERDAHLSLGAWAAGEIQDSGPNDLQGGAALGARFHRSSRK